MTSSQSLFDALLGAGQTLAFCESLTAGLAAATFADVPGASAVLRGGLVTYSSEVKAKFTGLSLEELERQGVVSAATAIAMAKAAAHHCNSDWALSLTGVAGPDLQEGKPVGTVYIGLAGPNNHISWRLVEDSGKTRGEIRSNAVAAAFGFLEAELENLEILGNGNKNETSSVEQIDEYDNCTS